MSNHQSKITSASEASTVEGHVNALFEKPSDKTGDDAPAICSHKDPLYRIGTAPRIQFDKRNEMAVQVKFKIFTAKEVSVDQGTSNKVVTRVRKGAAAPALTYNVVDSKMFNDGNVIELVECLFGKSLTDFRGLCANICEVYQPGMRNMVLKSDLAPHLKWMGQVGRAKVFLVDHQTWQSFVDLLSKATKRKGVITIFSKSEKEKAKKVAQACAAKELIASASGPTAVEGQIRVLTKELEDARKRIALHELAAQLFHQHAQNGTSGDGVILVCPWNPRILYRLTLNGAWVWAKGVESGMATREIPPRTYEFVAIMNKCRVFHKATKVEDRVKMRGDELQLNLSPTFHKSGGSSKSFFESPAQLLFPNPKPSGSKRSASFTISEDDKKKIKIEPGLPLEVAKKKTGINPNKSVTIVISSDPPAPIIKQESFLPVGFGKGETVVLSSDPPLPDVIFSSQDDKKIPAATTDPGQDLDRSAGDSEEELKAHAEALERFLQSCNVTKEDETTRTILKRAGVLSWTDLIPSVQFTENSLTSRGMHPSLASYLLSEALDRVNDMKNEIEDLKDEDDELEEEEELLSSPSPGI